ncbi:MAG: TraB/GumN family protein [Hyphomicrobium sp.]|nr:TraB/GumN family protein [Hyphomicrobium sp.]
MPRSARRAGSTSSAWKRSPAQLESLAAVPEQQQIDMLRASLKFADRTNDMMETLVQLYLSRKISAAMPFQIALAQQAGVTDQAFAGFQEKLLTERNEKMRAVAEPLLDKGGVFIAVGALHLPGDKGLVALLRESGYTVSPDRVVPP